MFTEIDACPVQQLRRFGKYELVLLNERLTHLNLFQIAQTHRPGGLISFGVDRKDAMHRSHHSLGPLSLSSHPIVSRCTTCTSRCRLSTRSSTCRLINEKLSNASNRRLKARPSATARRSAAGHCAAPSVSSSSGMASGARKAHRCNSSTAAGLLCSICVKESDQVVATGSG